MWWVLVLFSTVCATLAHLNYPHVATAVVARLRPRQPTTDVKKACLVTRTISRDWYSVGAELERTGIKKVVLTAVGDVWIGCNPSFDVENRHKVVVSGGTTIKVTGEFNTDLLVNCHDHDEAVWVQHGNKTAVEATSIHGEVHRIVVPLES